MMPFLVLTTNLSKGDEMKFSFLTIAVLVAMPRCMAYTEAELNLWYGNGAMRTPFDDQLEEVSSKPLLMSMQEYRAIQATNQTPVLADVIASNIAHAVQMGQSTNGVTWTEADGTRMSILPPPEPNEDWMHQRSRHLMMLMGVSVGDSSSVCTNWCMPTNICHNGDSFLISRIGSCHDRFGVYMATNAQQRVAHVIPHGFRNGRESRIEGFLTYLRHVRHGQLETAMGLSVNNLDAAANMLFLSSKAGITPKCDVLIYKNLVLHMCAETNTVNAAALAAEIINAGLPESERVPILPMP